MVPIALLVEIIPPERLGLERGAVLMDEQVMEAFGLDEPPKAGWRDGHLFLCVSGTGALVEPTGWTCASGT